MPAIQAGSLPWHEGEEKMHDLLRVPPRENPTVPFLTPGANLLLRRSPLLAIGAVDRQGRPWATVWGGEVGFATPISDSTIEIKPPIDREYDPVAEILLRSGTEDHPISQEPMELLSGLAIDLESRKRAKLHGRRLSGSPSEIDGSEIGHLFVHIDASLGNCPKYLNTKYIIPARPEPKLISDSPQLPLDAIKLIHRADCLFVSSRQGTVDMDTNIRGGPPGFVRIISNDTKGAEFIYPEYSGNRLYQTLGNLQVTPLAGFVFPDFETGNALYITGKTQVLVGKDAAAILPRSNLAVKVTVTAARYVATALSFRGTAGSLSPYNPPVRYLTTEKQISTALDDAQSWTTATMIKKDLLTPTIARFRFKISEPAKAGTWIPGQYATFSFQEELDMGYRHMNDEDPSSLNDDYVRTFTITSRPGQGLSAAEFEITVRRHGNVTSHLFRTYEGAGLEVPLKGFGGDFQLKPQEDQSMLPFVAGGIGITPALAQLPDLDIDRIRLFWSIPLQDIGLVCDVFQRNPQLPRSTTLFITGPDVREDILQKLDFVTSSGARIERRRMEASDLDLSLSEVWYFCGSPSLKASVLNWLAGKRVVYEDFNY